MAPTRSSWTPRSVAAALPDFGLAALFLATWLWPTSQRPETIQHLLLVMLLEFIIIHSAAFMGRVAISPAPREAKVKGLLALAGFYSLFAAGFSLAFKSAWPLLSFWGLMANRLASVIVGQAPEGEERVLLERGWGVCALAYLVFTFATVLLPVPRFGITPAIVAAQGIPGGGLWVDQPWRVLALGFCYFTVVGWSELNGHGWMRTAAGGSPKTTTGESAPGASRGANDRAA